MEGELVGVEEGVEEVVVFLIEDWVAHIPLVLKIQRKELHTNRLTSVTKAENRQFLATINGYPLTDISSYSMPV